MHQACGLGFSETMPGGLQRVAHIEHGSLGVFCLKAGRADIQLAHTDFNGKCHFQLGAYVPRWFLNILHIALTW